MESRYGIGINNRYALFIDQDDVEDEAILKKAAEAAKKAKEVKLKEKEMLPPAPANKETKAPVGNHQVSANAKKNETGKPEGNLKETCPRHFVTGPSRILFDFFSCQTRKTATGLKGNVSSTRERCMKDPRDPGPGRTGTTAETDPPPKMTQTKMCRVRMGIGQEGLP